MSVEVEASPEERLAFAKLQARLDELNAKIKIDVFAALRYEPACKPRVLAAKAITYVGDDGETYHCNTPQDALDRGHTLPMPCGLCPQERFHAADQHAVLYGGAMGGGKTRALLMEGIRAAMLYPGIRIGAFRRTYDELAESFLAELEKVDFAKALGAKWNAGTHTLTFPNRSIIRFRYAETVEHATRRQGGEYQLILFDEAGLVPAAVIEALEERQRSSNPRIPVLGIRLASNPGGHGHAALKIRFLDPTKYGERTGTDAEGRSLAFIPAKATDNPYLDPNYEAQLNSIKDPARRAAMRDGNWEVFVGQVFEEWNRDHHVVPRPKEGLPKTWERWVGIDYGRAAPWAVLWVAIDQDRRKWVYREMYEKGVGVRAQARMILDAESESEEKGVMHVIDPSTQNKMTDGPSIFELYAQEGLGCLPADNDRIAGWQKVHDALAVGPLCAVHEYLMTQGRYTPLTDEDGNTGCPMLHVINGAAPNLVRTLPDLPYSKTKVEDVDTTAEDHAPDALRYLLQMCGAVGGPVIYDEPKGTSSTRAPRADYEPAPAPGTAVSPFQ